MAEKSTRPRRRQYLIDRKFQLPVALALAGIGLAMLIYHLAVVHFIVTGAREGAVMETRPIATMLPLVALLVLSFGWLGIHVTHRIVGPAYRLTQTMKALTGGELSVRAHLRKGDALKEVAGALNELGDAIESRAQDERDLRARLRAAIEDGAEGEELISLLDRAELAAELGSSADQSDG